MRVTINASIPVTRCVCILLEIAVEKHSFVSVIISYRFVITEEIYFFLINCLFKKNI